MLWGLLPAACDPRRVPTRGDALVHHGVDKRSLGGRGCRVNYAPGVPLAYFAINWSVGPTLHSASKRGVPGARFRLGALPIHGSRPHHGVASTVTWALLVVRLYLAGTTHIRRANGLLTSGGYAVVRGGSIPISGDSSHLHCQAYGRPSGSHRTFTRYKVRHKCFDPPGNITARIHYLAG